MAAWRARVDVQLAAKPAAAQTQAGAGRPVRAKHRQIIVQVTLSARSQQVQAIASAATAVAVEHAHTTRHALQRARVTRHVSRVPMVDVIISAGVRNVVAHTMNVPVIAIARTARPAPVTVHRTCIPVTIFAFPETVASIPTAVRAVIALRQGMRRSWDTIVTRRRTAVPTTTTAQLRVVRAVSPISRGASILTRLDAGNANASWSVAVEPRPHLPAGDLIDLP